jgi:hypothetical protein
MQDTHFEITQTDDNGDCLFDTIRIAFEEIGMETSISQLREIIAKDPITENAYNETQTLVSDFNKQLKRLELLLKVATSEPRRKEINDEIKEVKGNIIDAVGPDFSQITTFDQYKNYIKTSNYWANEFTISLLERALNVKMIILSERDYLKELNSKKLEMGRKLVAKKESVKKIKEAVSKVIVTHENFNPVNCGIIDKELQKSKEFKPSYYIMTTFSGNHYRLITYRNKSIFSFSELPQRIKELVVISCTNGAEGGLFDKIEDFRTLRR